MTLPVPIRPSQQATLGNHETRIRALERQHFFGVDYAYAADAGTVAFGTTRYWDLSGAVPPDEPVTASPGIYSFDTFTSGSAIGKGGIKVQGPAMLQIDMVFQVEAESDTDTLHLRASELMVQGTANGFPATYQTGSLDAMILGYQHAQILYAIGVGEMLFGMSTTNNDGSGTPSGRAFLYIQRRDDRDWDSLPIPP